jgi:uncharacterized protein (TIGR00725 family)
LRPLPRCAHLQDVARDHSAAEERPSARPGSGRAAQNEEQRRPVIGVIGDGQPGSDRERLAAEVGASLARAGVHLVCGGLGGCMAGASRGYKEANGAGICLGLLPGTSRAEANPWVDLAIPTGVNSAQGALVAMAVDAAIVLGGGGGTLSEVGLLLRDGKPVVALGGTGGAAALVGGQHLGRVSVRLAHDAEEAVWCWTRSGTSTRRRRSTSRADQAGRVAAKCPAAGFPKYSAMRASA